MTTILNNFKIKPIKGTGHQNEQNIRGKDLFDTPYANIAIIGPKAHGKTTIIYNIVEEICYKNNVLIFSPTVHNDPSYKSMIKMLTDKKKCNVLSFDNFIDSKTGVNHIKELVNLLEVKEKEKEIVKKIEKLEEKLPVCNFGDPPKKLEKPKEDKPEKPTKAKPLTAEYVIIYDDLGNHMRDSSLYDFIIRNRHYKCTNIMALHNAVNILPGTWNNINYILCLANIPEEKFLKIQEESDIKYPGENKKNPILYEAYKKATSEKYSFLYINRDTRELRKNFNKKIDVET